MSWLKKLFERLAKWFGWGKKQDKPDSEPAPTLPAAEFSRCAYSPEEYEAMPVHPLTMRLHGNKLTVKGDALKLSEWNGMGCEVTWWYKWDGKTYARTIEGYRAGDCADGSASKDIPDGWHPRGGCGYYHDGEEGLTWWNVEDDRRGVNLGYTASKVVSRRNNAKAWRTDLIMPERG